MNMPGFGDRATWGPVWHPNDPRRDERFEDAERDLLECCIEQVQYQIGEAQRLIANGDTTGARKALAGIAEVLL